MFPCHRIENTVSKNENGYFMQITVLKYFKRKAD